jgi:hypothetical protein
MVIFPGVTVSVMVIVASLVPLNVTLSPVVKFVEVLLFHEASVAQVPESPSQLRSAADAGKEDVA